MAESKAKGGNEPEAGSGNAQAGAAQTTSLGIRLVAVNNSDQPVVSNYVSLNISPSMAFVDFGFLEPSVLAALPRVAQSGGKLPERLDGKLAVRVAMGYDSLANLHQQLGRVLASVGQQRGGEKKGD